jgi:hypothetical protein
MTGLSCPLTVGGAVREFELAVQQAGPGRAVLTEAWGRALREEIAPLSQLLDDEDLRRKAADRCIQSIEPVVERSSDENRTRHAVRHLQCRRAMLMGVIPVGPLGLGVGDRVEPKLVRADLLCWRGSDVRCAFRIEAEEHKILRRLRGDVEPVEMHVGDVVPMEAGRPLRRQERKIGKIACAIGPRRDRGTVVDHGVARMVRPIHGEPIGKR